MTADPRSFQLFVGIDIAAASFTAVWNTNTGNKQSPLTFAQSPAGWQQFCQRIASLRLPPSAILIIMESTGVYWMRLAHYLTNAGYAVWVVNPLQAKRFAQLTLKRDKTDPIDAQTLADFAAQFHHQARLWSPPPSLYEDLYQRLTQRDALAELRAQTRNRTHALQQRNVAIPIIKQRSEQVIMLLNSQVKATDGELATLLKQGDWRENAKRLLSIKGMGIVTVSWLLVVTLNFSLFETPEQLVSYVGLAPRSRQSGTSLNARPGIGYSGHPRLRQLLFLATLSAVRHNLKIKTLYDRLIARGKAKKVALCAAARKLLHICWALVKHERMFNPNYTRSRKAG